MRLKERIPTSGHGVVRRTVNNFMHIGEDGKTPAMRLGLAREPLRYEDILWPGEHVPRPKRVRRKGRAILVPARAARQG